LCSKIKIERIIKTEQITNSRTISLFFYKDNQEFTTFLGIFQQPFSIADAHLQLQLYKFKALSPGTSILPRPLEDGEMPTSSCRHKSYRAMVHTDIAADHFLRFDGMFKVRVTMLAHLSN